VIREPPPFFHRGPSPLARLTFFMLFAIGLMIADHRFHALATVRLSLSALAQPVQQVAAWPSQLSRRFTDYFTSQQSLLRENQELKAKILEQAALSQEARLLRAEHEYLLGLSAGKSRYAEGGTIAEVVSAARNPFTRKIWVDKGLQQGLRPGMPVIDGIGVVGQVTSVSTFTSEVTLVTEKDQSVPVMILRNGQRAIAVGSGKEGVIDVPFVPLAADVQSGDVFVTSGIDGTYPPGLVVAQVTSVEKNAALPFTKIAAKPLAGVENHRFVLILPSPPTMAPRPESKPGDDAKKSARERGAPRRAR
jgi:rod shape-determining protein MreC